MWMADLWCDVFGPGRRSIIRDIPGPDQCNLGIIAPLAWLYRLTGRPRYRELAQFVVAEIEAEYGPNWVTLAGQGKHCDEMRGIHALEQLFVFEGLMDLSFITGDPRLREAMLHWWRDMTERERMAHGNLAPEELWHHQPHSPSWAETCVATAYIRFSLQVLYATADPRIADRIEEATLNAYFGAQRPDGVLWAYPVPVNGTRPFGWYELKPEDPDLGCCFTYALTGMGLIPRWASMVAAGDEPALVTHYYGPGASAATVGDVNVRIEQDTRYPCEPEVTLHIRPDRPAEFAVWLRIPDWSTHTRAQVNGEPWLTVPPGKYLKLRRDWGPGDTVTLALDFTPRVVEGSGETSGRVAIYRGPLLLTLDQRFNPDDQSGQSPLEVAHLVLQPYDQAVPGPPPWVLFQAPTVDGREVILCDFASAGALGERYESWIVAR
jgi:DUF1680 family protein